MELLDLVNGPYEFCFGCDYAEEKFCNDFDGKKECPVSGKVKCVCGEFRTLNERCPKCGYNPEMEKKEAEEDE